MRQGILIYHLQDFKDDPIEGAFYQQELVRAEPPEDNTYKIEKNISKEKVGGKTFYKVKFWGWPSKFNELVPALAVKDLAKKLPKSKSDKGKPVQGSCLPSTSFTYVSVMRTVGTISQEITDSGLLSGYQNI